MLVLRMVTVASNLVSSVSKVTSQYSLKYL